jgi:cytochrome b/b6/petB-like protein
VLIMPTQVSRLSQKAVRGGALVRGLHVYGASAMIVLVVAHVAQTFLFGAYKQGRELVWLVGGLLLLLILAFAFTGYLLPWDQEAYFATRVGVSITGEVPLVGPAQRRVMLGGNDLTSLTLSRFFAVHVLALPLLLGVLIVVHVYLFRQGGPKSVSPAIFIRRRLLWRSTTRISYPLNTHHKFQRPAARAASAPVVAFALHPALSSSWCFYQPREQQHR